MDGKKPLQYHKSPSRASRVVCETLNSEKLVWLAPVSSPLLSPGREKMQMVRKKVKRRSIFVLPRRAKVSIEAEEPTSPKVSCIGQVRTSKKHSFADSKAGKSHHYKPGSSSPARFISSPGRELKWGSLFRSRKDAHCAAPRSLVYGGREVSCSGFPRDSPSGYNSKRSCSAFFAKSLLLLQECEERAESSKSEVAPASTHTHSYSQLHARAHIDVVEKQIDSILPIPSNQPACEQGDTHDIRVSDTSSEPICNVIQQEESYAHQILVPVNPCNGSSELKRPIDLCDAKNHVPLALPPVEDQQERTSEAEKNFLLALPFEENQQGSAHDSTREELHCSSCNKQDLNISVEVAPETWLCRNDEDSKRDGASFTNGVFDESVMGSSSNHLRKAQEEEVLTSSSCDEEYSSHGEEAFTLSLRNEECSLHEATDCCIQESSSCHSQFKATDLSTSTCESEDSYCIHMCALKE